MEILKMTVRGQNRAGIAGPEERQGLPERVRRGNRMRAETCPLKRTAAPQKGTAKHQPVAGPRRKPIVYFHHMPILGR
jgi:hypothetical protein